MRSEHYPLDVPATATVGQQLDVRQLHDKWVYCYGVTAAVATIVFEGSADDVHWFALKVQGVGADPASDVTADGLFEVPQNILSLRVNRTVAGSGAVSAVIVGRMAHG